MSPQFHSDASLSSFNVDVDKTSTSCSETSIADTESVAKDFRPGWKFYFAFLSLIILIVMVALDATSLPLALPMMSEELKGSGLESFWSGTSFLVASTIFQTAFGSFSRIFGCKPVLFLSLILFGIGAITASLAQSFIAILAGRCLQGVGGGGIITITEIAVTDMVPLRLRGQWLASISAAWAIGTVTGPLLGGGFAQSVSWRWIFWINLPFLGVGGILIVLFLRLDRPALNITETLLCFDWIGAFFFTASVTGFLIPMTWGGIQYPWNHWRTLVPLIISLFGLILFVIWEEGLVRRGQMPFVQLDTLKTRNGAVIFIGTALHGMLVWMILYFQSFYFQAIKGQSPILAGVCLFPQTFTVAPVSVLTGILISRTGRYRWAIWAGWILMVLGSGLLIVLEKDTSNLQWISLSLVGGIGAGLLFPALTVALQASSTNSGMAYAVILFSTFRALGQTIGVAVGGVVFQNVIEKELETYPLLAPYASIYSRDAGRIMKIILAAPAGLEQTQLIHSCMQALKAVYIVCTAVAATGLFFSFYIQELSLDRPLETAHGFIHSTESDDEETKVL